MEGRYNLRSPAVKRLMREAQELAEPTEQYSAQPLDDNLFEWHFTIRGPSDSDFSGGIYHGRIILPPDYPMKPPSIIFLTANGRFDCFTKICLSISKHHPESWQPGWSIRTALLAIIGFMPTPGHGAIGSLDYTTAERNALAKRSASFMCEQCGLTAEKLLPLTSKSDDTRQEIINLGAQLSMTAENSKAADTAKPKQGAVGDAAAAAGPASASLSPPVDLLRQRLSSPGDGAAGSLTTDSRPAGTTPVPRDGTARDGVHTAPIHAPSQSQPRPPAQVRQSSSERGSGRSCLNTLTYWSLVIVGLLLILLILRRFLLRYKTFLDMTDPGSADEL